jgi:hypothetical protein
MPNHRTLTVSEFMLCLPLAFAGSPAVKEYRHEQHSDRNSTDKGY